MLPKRQAPTLVNVTPSEELIGAWFVWRSKSISLTITNPSGTQSITPVLRTRLSENNPWSLRPQQFNTLSGDGIIAPLETASVDVDPGAVQDLAVFAAASGVGINDVVLTASDEPEPSW